MNIYDNNTMNTIKAYKALSVVANVDQGELIKRLIKENEKLKEEKKLIFKYHDAELQVLVDRLEEEDINNCSRCDKWYENCEWKADALTLRLHTSRKKIKKIMQKYDLCSQIPKTIRKINQIMP